MLLDVGLLTVGEATGGFVVEPLEGVALDEVVNQGGRDVVGAGTLEVHEDAAAQQRDDVGADAAVLIARLIDDGPDNIVLFVGPEESLAGDEDGVAGPLLAETAQTVAATLQFRQVVVVDAVLQAVEVVLADGGDEAEVEVVLIGLAVNDAGGQGMALVHQVGYLAEQHLGLVAAVAEDFLELVKHHHGEERPPLAVSETAAGEEAPEVVGSLFVSRRRHHLDGADLSLLLTDGLRELPDDALLERAVACIHRETEADWQVALLAETGKYTGIEQRGLARAALAIEGDEDVAAHKLRHLVRLVVASAEQLLLAALTPGPFRVFVGRESRPGIVVFIFSHFRSGVCLSLS